ncbi:MAG: diguanylate cyclase [Desulfobacterium sp.]|nr:diguanylate cyclase [Desulfobacterium sp.]
MKTTDQTLLEQLKITPREIRRRKEYLDFTQQDVKQLESIRELIVDEIDDIVELFYKKILPFDEMDRVIGDAETLTRLKNYQRQYILSLFGGQYDEEYVHSRLRVGVVHKRIGLDPKYYISAVHNLKSILRELISKQSNRDCASCTKKQSAIEKILMFDLSLTVDTYISSLIAETRRSRDELENYAESLEETVAQRTQSLKELARHDGLTGLINQHTFYEELKRELSRASRLNRSTVLIYFDLDGFKNLNDTQGHKAGDAVLVAVAAAMEKVTRENEVAARYGGDEFCIILSARSLNDGKIVSERLCDEIKKSIPETSVTCSIGIAISTPEKSLDANALVKTADKAMYAAKKEAGFSIRIADQA